MTTKSVEDHLSWGVHLVVEKYADDEALRRGGSPDEVVERYGNMLLNNGINVMLNLLAGNGVQAFATGHCRFAVGNGIQPVTATQIDLQGSSRAYKVCESGYPLISGNSIEFRSVFPGTGVASAPFEWTEWGIDNGSADADNSIGVATMLNRKVEGTGSIGTKATQPWLIDAVILING